MLVQPNFTEEMKPMVAGTYLCRILSCEGKISKSGNHYLNWKLETLPEKRTVYYSTPIEGRGAGMFKHLVNCISDEPYESGPIETDQLLEKTVTMMLQPETIVAKDGQKKTVFTVKSVMKPTFADQKLNENEDIPF